MQWTHLSIDNLKMPQLIEKEQRSIIMIRPWALTSANGGNGNASDVSHRAN